MENTVTLARVFSMSPFEIMAQDSDDVIMLINYYIEKSDEAPEAGAADSRRSGKHDGFWDF